MTPDSLAAVPGALKDADATAMLYAPIEDFLNSKFAPGLVTGAVRTVAMILRIGRVSGLCTSEVDSLLANRFSSEIARQVREHLWDWLLTGAAGPGEGLHNEADIDDHDDALIDIGDEPDLPASVPSLRVLPPPVTRESPPSIEAPPQNGEALDRWADRYGVRERLADRLPLEHLRNSYYGYALEGLPSTVREAMLATPSTIGVPKQLRSYMASQVVSMAKAYVHRAAQAVVIAHRRQDERAARSCQPDDPFLRRLEDLVRREHDRLAAEAKPRPAGTYLPGRIYLAADPPALTYKEWER